MNSISETLSSGEVILYKTDEGAVWLTLQQMAQFYDRDRSVISRHVHSAFPEEELYPEATCAKFAQVQMEVGRKVVHELIASYSHTWCLLLEYDEDRLTAPTSGKSAVECLEYDHAVSVIKIIVARYY